MIAMSASEVTVVERNLVLHGARNSIVVTPPPSEYLRNRHQFTHHARGT